MSKEQRAGYATWQLLRAEGQRIGEQQSKDVVQKTGQVSFQVSQGQTSETLVLEVRIDVDVPERAKLALALRGNWPKPEHKELTPEELAQLLLGYKLDELVAVVNYEL